MRVARSTRLRAARLAAALALAVAAAAGAGACGGDEGSSEEATRLLDEALSKPIGTARLTLDVEIDVDGIEELKDPIRLKIAGPYRDGGEKSLPGFDWDIGLAGGGQSLQVGLLSTQRNVFVEFQGTSYEIGEEEVGRINRQLAQAAEREPGAANRFGIEPRAWLRDAREEGDEEVAGVETRHVSATLDVGRMLDGLNTLIDRAGGQVQGAQPPPKLTEEQQRRIEEVVEDPRFDVYVGKADGIVRRLSTDLELNVPDDARERLNGLEKGTISFSIEFAEVGREQRIEAPERARPIQELSTQLGGLGALSGGLGPQNGTPPPSGGGPDESGRAGSPESQQFERYSRCLEEADPSKIEEIERCSTLLR